jgi:transcriptional regulator with XRE-family HTH domain
LLATGPDLRFWSISPTDAGSLPSGLTERRHRGRTGLIQRDLAARVGVSRGAVQDWEAGLNFPTAERLQVLIQVLLEAGGLTLEQEAAEAPALRTAVEREAPRMHTPFDEAWLAALLAAPTGSAFGRATTAWAGVCACVAQAENSVIAAAGGSTVWRGCRIYGNVIDADEKRLCQELTRPPLAPQASMHWSHDLLANAERRLFRRLAVFAGGWTLEASEVTTGVERVVDVLGGLVDRSLVIAESAATRCAIASSSPSASARRCAATVARCGRGGSARLRGRRMAPGSRSMMAV